MTPTYIGVSELYLVFEMARTYIPQDVEYVDCPSRGEQFKYKISFGVEEWSFGLIKKVIKVQIEEDGKVKGRLNTSFPTEGDEFVEVMSALNRMYEKYRGMR
jgi:hypothetical protein